MGVEVFDKVPKAMMWRGVSAMPARFSNRDVKLFAKPNQWEEAREPFTK